MLRQPDLEHNEVGFSFSVVIDGCARTSRPSDCALPACGEQPCTARTSTEVASTANVRVVYSQQQLRGLGLGPGRRPPQGLTALPAARRRTPESNSLGDLGAVACVTRSHHRVVLRKAPFAPIVVRRHAIFGHQVALERTVAFSIFKANEVVIIYRIFNESSRWRFFNKSNRRRCSRIHRAIGGGNPVGGEAKPAARLFRSGATRRAPFHDNWNLQGGAQVSDKPRQVSRMYRNGWKIGHQNLSRQLCRAFVILTCQRRLYTFRGRVQ